MVWKRHPDIVAEFVAQLEGVTESEHLRCAVLATRNLDGVQGFKIPSWRALAGGTRPPPRDLEDHESRGQRQGWQHEALSRMEREFRDAQFFPAFSDAQRTHLRSKSGLGAGMFLCTTPCNPITRLDSFTLRVLICRRLRLPLPLTKHTAGVAAALTSVDITVQLVPCQGFSHVGGFAMEGVVANV